MLPEIEASSTTLRVLYSVGVVILFCVIAGAVNIVLSAVIRHRNRADEHSLDARLLSTSKGPILLFIVILGLLMAYQVLAESTHSSLAFLSHNREWAFRVWIVVVIFEVSYLASHVLQALTLWYLENIADRTASDLDEKLLPQVRRVLPIVVYSLGILMALDLLGISITPLVAGLGIGGLAVALAVQPTLSSFLSGTYLITEGELNEGDFVELEGGPSGFVMDVGWRSTKIRDRFNNLIMIPNSKLIESVMTNYYSHSQVMTAIVNCGVSYDSDLAHVEAVALEVAAQVRDDLDEAVKDFDPVLRFTNFGDSNIDLVVVLQAVDRVGTFVVRHQLIKRLHARFNHEGIEINYPVRKLVGLPGESGLST